MVLRCAYRPLRGNIRKGLVYYHSPPVQLLAAPLNSRVGLIQKINRQVDYYSPAVGCLCSVSFNLFHDTCKTGLFAQDRGLLFQDIVQVSKRAFTEAEEGVLFPHIPITVILYRDFTKQFDDAPLLGWR